VQLGRQLPWGRVQREGQVVHIVADELIDLFQLPTRHRTGSMLRRERSGLSGAGDAHNMVATAVQL
jgi:hypothetical protein